MAADDDDERHDRNCRGSGNADGPYEPPHPRIQGSEQHAERDRPDDCRKKRDRQKVAKDQSADNRQGQYDVRDRPKIGNAASGHRIPHKPSQPSRSCLYVPFFYRGETAKLEPYDFLSHRFPLYFALPQAISTANVYAGDQTG